MYTPFPNPRVPSSALTTLHLEGRGLPLPSPRTAAAGWRRPAAGPRPGRARGRAGAGPLHGTARSRAAGRRAAAGPRRLAAARPAEFRLRGAWLLFALAAAVTAAIALRYTRAVEPSGDEIDYLLMAQSVWREGDLDLRDNFARRDYREYLGGLARMPGGVRDDHGRYRPTHSGGFAVVLAPAYALGGRTGCVVLLALLAAGLGLLVRDLALRATGDDDGGARGVGGQRRATGLLLHCLPLHRGRGRTLHRARPAPDPVGTAAGRRCDRRPGALGAARGCTSG